MCSKELLLKGMFAVIILSLMYGIISAYLTGSSDAIDAAFIYLAFIFLVGMTVYDYVKKSRSKKKKKEYLEKGALVMVGTFIPYTVLMLLGNFLGCKAYVSFITLLAALPPLYKAVEYLISLED
ncbi:MAG: hypothetical protein WC488_02935 [Candidatus Micrarchaeia archaeon]